MANEGVEVILKITGERRGGKQIGWRMHWERNWSHQRWEWQAKKKGKGRTRHQNKWGGGVSGMTDKRNMPEEGKIISDYLSPTFPPIIQFTAWAWPQSCPKEIKEQKEEIDILVVLLLLFIFNAWIQIPCRCSAGYINKATHFTQMCAVTTVLLKHLAFVTQENKVLCSLLEVFYISCLSNKGAR